MLRYFIAGAVGALVMLAFSHAQAAPKKCQPWTLGQCPTAHGGGRQTSHNFEAKIKNPDGTFHFETRSSPGPSGTRDGRSEGGNTAGGAHK